MSARARHSDPSTSHEAARSVRNLTDNQRGVMTILRMLGHRVLDEELVREYHSNQQLMRIPQQSDSGIRSRRCELAVAGYLMEGDKKRMTTGRLGRTWSIKEEEI